MTAVQTRISTGVDNPSLFYKQTPETSHECMLALAYKTV